MEFSILWIIFPNVLLGQTDLIPLKDTATVFLPNIVSTKNLEYSSSSISPRNKYICRFLWERPKPEKPSLAETLLEQTVKLKQMSFLSEDKFKKAGIRNFPYLYLMPGKIRADRVRGNSFFSARYLMMKSINISQPIGAGNGTFKV